MTFSKNEVVRLKSFQKRKEKPDGTEDPDNFWVLVGLTGKVIDTDEPPALMQIPGSPRVLVQFFVDIGSLGLHSHNPRKNSLWISEYDLAEEQEL